MTAPIRVLLVDDHALLRAGFRTILDTQPDITVVGEASTGAEAIAQAADLRPDVITMDVQMPDMDGIEATRCLVADPSVSAAIAIVTTFDRDDYLYQALEAGASGFLLKNAGAEDLISAVRALAAGDGMPAPEVTRRVLTRFAGATPETGAAPARAVTKTSTTPVLAEPLTEREAEVLTLLADARSNAEIARALFIGEATVKTHVSRILQKLGARDRVQAVVLAHRMGLA
ncbi:MULTISPECIES: response regulator [Microbacterium]|uniref:response regulator n=1 Tax=Microbacterium TaxID=33882 RepID=UPI000468968A|nr:MULTISPECIES: response regulator transcription factor [Microbacterium]AMG82812.1 LuxR family transcriptional regulator [Microbacterium sp. PAMC 28756]QXE29720.1 response regulator transcription factor [Microbacterium paraoxydans]